MADESPAAAAPVMDVQTAALVQALRQQQTPPMYYDPYTGTTETAVTANQSQPAPAPAAEAAPYFGGSAPPQALPAQTRDIHVFPVAKPAPTKLEAPSIPPVKYPLVPEILQKAAFTLNPAVQQARERMRESLLKSKAAHVAQKAK